jgi:hypothetical protein
LLLMELKDQASAPTLARKLGDTAHVSAWPSDWRV